MPNTPARPELPEPARIDVRKNSEPVPYYNVRQVHQALQALEVWARADERRQALQVPGSSLAMQALRTAFDALRNSYDHQYLDSPECAAAISAIDWALRHPLEQADERRQALEDAAQAAEGMKDRSNNDLVRSTATIIAALIRAIPTTKEGHEDQ